MKCRGPTEIRVSVNGRNFMMMSDDTLDGRTAPRTTAVNTFPLGCVCVSGGGGGARENVITRTGTQQQ